MRFPGVLELARFEIASVCASDKDQLHVAKSLPIGSYIPVCSIAIAQIPQNQDKKILNLFSKQNIFVTL